MSVKQISVFLENKPGSLSDMTQVLADNGIDMRAFSLAETSDFGIARVIVDDLYKTTTVLRDAGFVHTVSSVLAVAIPDVPGGLSHVLLALKEEKVNVEYMYAFVTPGTSNGAYLVLRARNNAKAERILAENGVKMLSEEDIARM